MKKKLRWPLLISCNILILALLIEVVFRFFPKLMPDFPQWNYGIHHTFYKKNVLDRLDSIGHKKPAVIFLGDSFLRGAEVQWGKEWLARLQKKNKDFELVNMGFNGSAQLEEYIYLENFILSTKAKMNGVVLVFYRNDFLDNIEHQNIYEEGGKEPFLNRLKKDTVDNRRFGNIRKFLDTYFYSYRLIKYVLRGTSNYMKSPPTETHVLLEEAGVYYDWERAQFPWNLPEDYIEITEKYINQLYLSVKKENVPFVIMYVPSKLVVYRDLIEPMLEGKSLSFIDSERGFLKNYCSRNQIPFYDFSSHFIENRDQGLFLEIDSHWNEIGHQILADKLHELNFLDHFKNNTVN